MLRPEISTPGVVIPAVDLVVINDSRCVTIDRPLRASINHSDLSGPVLKDLSVRGHQNKTFRGCLRNEHPVERVLVNRGKVVNPVDVFRSYGQRGTGEHVESVQPPGTGMSYGQSSFHDLKYVLPIDDDAQDIRTGQHSSSNGRR